MRRWRNSFGVAAGLAWFAAGALAEEPRSSVFQADSRGGAATPQDPAKAVFAGQTLAEALFALQGRGLTLVFTDQVVLPGMKVQADPRATTPRGILAEVLAPHGLGAQEEAGGVLVVVPVAEEPPRDAALRGAIAVELAARGELGPVRGATLAVVGPEPRVVDCSIDGRCLVGELAAGSYALETQARGFLAGRVEAVVVQPGKTSRLAIELQPQPYVHDEIVIQSSQLALLQDEPAAPIAIARGEMNRVPHLGGDLFRALSLLPGITANDVTARFSIHGGRRDEVAVILDGQELYDTFHLKDYDGALSAVPAKNLGSAKLTTGALDASYGDRMGGALDLTTIQAAERQRTLLGLSSVDALLQGSGQLPNDRGSWLASGRRGFLDLAGRAIGSENPALWDVLGKLELRLGESQLLGIRTLATADDLDFEEREDGGFKRLQNDYDDRYAWLRHQGIAGASLLVESGLAWTRITRDRNGRERDDKGSFDVADQRRTDIAAATQTFSLAAGAKHLLRWGWQVRDYDAAFDYRNRIEPEFELEGSWTATRDEENAYRGDQRSRHTEIWISDRVTLREALTVELGLRHDRHSLSAEELWSPRASLAWSLAPTSVLRASWGQYRQSQRPFELQVEDGLATLAPAESARHWVVGWEQLFDRPGAFLRAFRLELFQRRVANSRVRFENALEQLNTLPEIEPDRIRIVPDASSAEGVEAVLRGALGRKADWWVVYSYARATDEIAGRTTPRQTDQPHALSVNLNLPAGAHWNFHLAWRYHTGWPTTPVTATAVEDEGETEVVPVLGSLNSERLPVYHRLDLRATRSWRLRAGELELYFDIQNVYDHDNIAGFDLGIDDQGAGITLTEEHWPGFFPSVGVSFEF